MATEEFEAIKRRIVRWVNDHREKIGLLDPAMPPQLLNRAADNWRPLLAIAEVADGEWPKRAREAALAAYVVDANDDAILEILLADIRNAVRDRGTQDSRDIRQLADEACRALGERTLWSVELFAHIQRKTRPSRAGLVPNQRQFGFCGDNISSGRAGSQRFETL